MQERRPSYRSRRKSSALTAPESVTQKARGARCLIIFQSSLLPFCREEGTVPANTTATLHVQRPSLPRARLRCMQQHAPSIEKPAPPAPARRKEEPQSTYLARPAEAQAAHKRSTSRVGMCRPAERESAPGGWGAPRELYAENRAAKSRITPDASPTTPSKHTAGAALQQCFDLSAGAPCRASAWAEWPSVPDSGPPSERGPGPQNQCIIHLRVLRVAQSVRFQANSRVESPCHCATASATKRCQLVRRWGSRPAPNTSRTPPVHPSKG